MGEKGEGSGGEGGGKWGERGRELEMGHPPVHPLISFLRCCASVEPASREHCQRHFHRDLKTLDSDSSLSPFKSVD